MPGAKNEAPVLCNGCLGSNASGQLNDGLPTWPYDSPIKDHVGRYVDSSSTASFQHIGFRTARARYIRSVPEQRGSAPPRIYIQIGDAIGAYSFDEFFSTKLPGGMVSVGGVKTGSPVGGFGRTPLEKILMWDGFVYPEATAAQWHCPFQDGQDRLGQGGPIDVDDRGHVYGAYTVFGWGIVKDDGRSTGTHFQTVAQMIPGGTTGVTGNFPYTKNDQSGFGPLSIVAMKVGSKYYAVTATMTDKDAAWDVTDAASPRLLFVRDAKGYGIRKWDRDDTAKRVAIVTGRDKHLRIYDYDDFATSPNPVPVYENTASFADVSFDESGNVWAAETDSRIWKISPAGGGYTATSYSPHAGRFTHLAMHSSAGFVVVAGTDLSGGAAYDVRLLKIEAGGLRDIDLGEFFKKYYHKAPAGYAQPAGNNGIAVQADVQIVKSGGKTYLMYSSIGLGDVFEIEGEDTISIKVKNNTFGTTNPNSKATVAGPYVGDTVTFTAPSSNPQVVYDVTWDFGNPESSDNTGLKKSTQEISHQYTGLNTSAKVTAPKTVRAITVQSSQIASQYSLSLKVPTPRVGITGVTNPITANTTGLEVLAGQTFNDASDGSIEGHYSIWTIDSVETKLAPDDEISSGAVGPHTLTFQGAYGKYDGSFNSTSPYLTSPITVAYTAKPFLVDLNPPTKVGSDVKFTAAAPKASDGSITAQTWDVTWKKNGTPVGATAANGLASNAAVPAGTVPELLLPMSSLVDGDVITVTIDVDPADLTTPAQAYAQAVDTVTLSKPDPKITKTGCDNAGSPCSFTASSVSGASVADWTFAWTLKKGGSTYKVGTTNPFTPAVTDAGSYTIELVATKTVFDTPATPQSLTVAESLCQPLPAAHLVSITKVGCSTSCAAGTTVQFWPTMQGYQAQDCDTYSWSFGSGQGTGSGEVVSHKYDSAGTYTVTLTISNPNGNLTKTTTVTVTGGTTPPPPPPTCTAPTAAAISYSGCSGGCKTTDTISFSARRGSSSLHSCDSVRWNFGDGTTSVSRTPTKKYSNPGTYTVEMYIQNSNGTSPTATQTFTITQGTTGGGTCSMAPGPGNFAILFTGPDSGCTNFNGQECKRAESISFDAQDYYYAPASCDNYEWDFGDGTAKVNTRQATHTFSSSGSFPLKLRVYNNAGQYTYTKTIKIEGTVATQPVPQISATTFPANAVKGKAVTFTATSNNPNTTGWTWSFGDGTASDTSQAGQTKQSSTITHTFTKTGTFQVKATARNAADAPTAPVGTAQGNIVVADAPAIPEFVYLLPVTAHVPGQGGSKWRTDVQIYNPDPEVSEAKPLVMEAAFKGHAYPLQMIKATHIYEDFLGMLLSQQKDDSGPVIITTKSAMTPPQIWTRTYNQSENGTFGQFIPAIRLDNAGSAGATAEGKYYLAGLRHDDRYRTNVGFLNPNATAITATITVYDDRYLGIKQFTRTLQPFQLDQFTLKTLVPNLPDDRPFSLEIQVPPGQWLVAYASYIDGISQDPVFLQAVRDTEVASADFKTTVIPGVGHTGAWRSDVTIFNPDSRGVQFDLQFFDMAGNKVAETPGIVLDPFKFLQYGDILKQGVLGDVPDGLGTLKIINTSAIPNDLQPMSFARTYNDDGANGTFGQGIPAFAAARANVKPGKPALLAGVRNTSGQYYTNIGLVNLTDGPVTATVTLLDPVGGGAVSSIPYSLNPNQSVVGRYNGWGSIVSGTFKIEATGDVWAFASVVDERTKDPEYVAATPMQLP